MENIGRFLDGCIEYGCSKTDLFQTVDLFEETNMPAVRKWEIFTIVVLFIVAYIEEFVFCQF